MEDEKKCIICSNPIDINNVVNYHASCLFVKTKKKYKVKHIDDKHKSKNQQKIIVSYEPEETSVYI